jgi:acyl carrier protein
MEKQDIITKVNDILIDKLCIDNRDEVKPEAKLAEDFGADSLDAIDVTMEIEQQFGISISDYQMHQMTDGATVQDIYTMVEEALK